MLLEENKSKVCVSVKNKKWTKIPCDHALANSIKQKLEIPYEIAEILSRKKLTPEELQSYLNPKLKNLLSNTTPLLDINKAASIVADAIKSQKKIAVFGDYDVDGATSSALIKRFLQSIGHDAQIYIPDRVFEGYGPNIEALKKLHKDGASVIITVDCGSSSHDTIEKAKKLGLTIIVIDHHMCGGNLPKADAIVNPNREDDQSGYGYLAAVGVSFLFVIELCKKLTAENLLQGYSPDLLSLLDLVALGTVCDVVPLVDANRALVKQGTKVIESRMNTGIKALLDVSRVTTDISTYHLGFALGPRINAGGRVGKSSLGSELLVSNDYAAAMEIALKLDTYNGERKAIEMKVLEEALEFASAIDTKFPIICVADEGWHQGVIGIVAGRLKDRYNKPAAVISFDKEGIGKASCRSIDGIDFGKAVIEAKKKGILLNGGGHTMAAGFTVHKEKLQELQDFFIDSFQDIYNKLAKKKVHYFDSYISIDSANIEFIKYINKLGPFGNSNSQPRFILKNVSVVHANILKGDHISCIITEFGKGSSNTSLRAIAFGAIQNPIGEVLLAKKYNLNLLVTLDINKWQGNENPQIVIHDALIEN